MCIPSYKHTVYASYISIICQAVVNNLPPLLYVTFADSLGFSMLDISVLISANFAMQIFIDFFGTFFIDRIGYKKSIIIADIFVTTGLLSLGVLPQIMSDKFVSVLIAMVISGIGGGLLEVVASPIIEACPTDKKSSAMSLLHSFYSWGQVGVILIATVYFSQFGLDNWHMLPMLCAAIPAVDALYFIFVPVNSLPSDKGFKGVKALITTRLFWVMMIIMLAAGASELAMSQWASMFAEKGLGVSKAIGDILGPCAFAIFMGIGRVIFAKFGERLKLEKWICGSFVLCLITYLITALSTDPYISLMGCMLSGLSVALMWPGTYSLGAKHIPMGGTLMFALFAFAGDIGCALGPALIGAVSDYVFKNGPLLGGLIIGDLESVGMKTGILLASLFPLAAILACIVFIRCIRSKNNLNNN